MTTALQMVGITKTFAGGIVANDHIDFTLEMGEIHALLGENGAGKSTLMNMLYGLYRPDAGHIYLNPESTVIAAAAAAKQAASTQLPAPPHNDEPLLQEVHFTSPSDAIAYGIGMVHQHFMLIPTLTVAENIMLGIESTRGLFLDQRAAAARIRTLSQQFGLDVNPAAYVRDLPVGNQQRVEIIKALYRNADILILDEPTAVLTPQEAEELFTIMRELAAEGKSIIFITHKLKEVLAVAQRITVLRQGKVVAVLAQPATGTGQADEASLAQMMVGREVLLTVQKGPAYPTAPVLVVENLRVADDGAAGMRSSVPGGPDRRQHPGRGCLI
ncbi:MAG: ATP-binding cassette domain-containing protein [Chloroflexi bacterium]|nr:ATP-binding cassette domain-containing protein [Chloroflexota bacterium]